MAGVIGALALPCVALLALFVLVFANVWDCTRFEAAEGQSILVTQDGFDGDLVSVYTEYDAFHYVAAPSADTGNLSRHTRIKNQGCRLDAKESRLLLTCGTDTISIDAGPAR